MAGVAVAQDMTTEQKYQALKDKGIFSGVSDGQAGLDQSMSRAQFARVAALILGLEGTPVTNTGNSFEDIDPSKYQNFDSASYLASITGANSGVFQPTSTPTPEELALIVAQVLGLEVGVDTEDDLLAYHQKALAAVLAQGTQMNLSDFAALTPALYQAMLTSAEEAARDAEAQRRELELRKQELLRAEQERLGLAAANRWNAAAQQMGTLEDILNAAREAALREAQERIRMAQEELAATREDAERRKEELLRQTAQQQAAALAARQNATSWPAWMTADSRYADLSAGRTTELSTLKTFYSGEARATDGNGNDIVGSFSAFFHGGPSDLYYDGAVFGLEFYGDVQRGKNAFNATIYPGSTDLSSGTSAYYAGGTLDGHFYGKSGQAVGGTVNLVGSGSPDMSGHFVGVAP